MAGKKIDPALYSRVATAAAELGVARTTLNSAVQNGYVKTAELRDGCVLVEITSARKWHAAEKKRGPKPKP